MISPLAYVDPNAKLGKDVEVEPFACIYGDVEIGDGTWIAPHAVIKDGARIGCNCKIHSGAVIASIPQDLKFKGEYSTAVVGDRTMVRECATISRGTSARGVTTVGSDTLIMAYAHVGHDCVVGNHCILVNNVSLAGEVEVGDWAILGGHCAVHQFSKIGEHVMVSGGTLVNKDIPPYVICAHSPNSFVGLNIVGLRRRGFTADQIREIQDISRILYQSGLPYSKGMEMVESTIPQSELRDKIVGFIRSSSRGIFHQYSTKVSNEQ